LADSKDACRGARRAAHARSAVAELLRRRRNGILAAGRRPDARLREGNIAMRRMLLAILATLCLAPAASAEPKTIALWHVFTLETDMIHGAIKGFNGAQADYRIDARIVAGPQITTELTKAMASGAVPDLVTIDNPIVASFSAQGTLTDLTD